MFSFLNPKKCYFDTCQQNSIEKWWQQTFFFERTKDFVFPKLV